MSDEARITCQLTILNGTFRHNGTGPAAFTVDVTGQKGPVPGAIAVSILGTDVDLSQLTHPGLCEIYNPGPTYTFEYGTWDPNPGVFHPLGECAPGEKYLIKLSRNLGGEYGSTGTGTLNTQAIKMRLRGIGGAAVASINAFEK